MSLLFRVDAGRDIGAGHVMRCLTLADAWAQQGRQSWFVMRKHPGHLGALVAQRGHQVCLLPLSEKPLVQGPASGLYQHWLGGDFEQDAAQTAAIAARVRPQWLVVDHYGAECEWELRVAPPDARLMVIDDLADRRHHCDLLLDQNHGREASDYRNLLSPYTRVLCGASYTLLRPEFSRCRAASLARRPVAEIQQLLINFGGVDAGNATGRALAALQKVSLAPTCRLVVVLGATNPWKDEVTATAARLPWRCDVLVGVDNMAELLLATDLAIGAVGSSTWERCCLGVPSILAVLADNQREVAVELAAAGIIALVELDDLELSLPAALARALADPRWREALGAASSVVTDGQGVQRVMATMQEMM